MIAGAPTYATPPKSSLAGKVQPGKNTAAYEEVRGRGLLCLPEGGQAPRDEAEVVPRIRRES